jgi:hypothetical protein
MTAILFFGFNDDILINLFSTWCQFLDIVMLDSAFCSKDNRYIFWRIMTDPRMASIEVYKLKDVLNFKWFFKRNVKVKNLILSRDFNGINNLRIKDVPSNAYGNIVTLTFFRLDSTFNTKRMVRFLNSCPKLLHLSVSYCDGMDKCLSSLNSCVWRSLTKLALIFLERCDLLTLQICSYCSQLVSLKLSTQLLTEFHLQQIILRNPLISDLSYHDTHCGLTGATPKFVDFLIPSFMKNILDLHLTFTGEFNIRSLFPLLDSCSRFTNRICINFDNTIEVIELEYYRSLSKEKFYWQFVEYNPNDMCNCDNGEECGHEEQDAEKRMVDHLETLGVIGKPAFYSRGCIHELWEHQKIVPFAFFENLVFIRQQETTIFDALFTVILKSIPSLEVVCLEYPCEKYLLDVNKGVVHPNYYATEPFSEFVDCSFRLLTNQNDVLEVPRVTLVWLSTAGFSSGEYPVYV